MKTFSLNRKNYTLLDEEVMELYSMTINDKSINPADIQDAVAETLEALYSNSITFSSFANIKHYIKSIVTKRANLGRNTNMDKAMLSMPVKCNDNNEVEESISFDTLCSEIDTNFDEVINAVDTASVIKKFEEYREFVFIDQQVDIYSVMYDMFYACKSLKSKAIETLANLCETCMGLKEFVDDVIVTLGCESLKGYLAANI